MYSGGLDQALEVLRSDPDKYKAEDWKFFTGYAGWGPGQLNKECTENVWWPIAASNQVPGATVRALRAGVRAGQGVPTENRLGSSLSLLPNDRPSFTCTAREFGTSTESVGLKARPT